MKFPFPGTLFRQAFSFRRTSRSETLGLEIRPDGVAWALDRAGQPLKAGFEESSPAERESVLKRLVHDLGIGRCRVCAVLPLDQYQVFAVERPPVEAAELAAAVRWKVKDLIDFPLEDATADVYESPDGLARGQGDVINAVVSRKPLVQELAALVDAAGLELAQVNIAELSLRNLLQDFTGAHPSTALVYLRERHGHMVVCQGANLYLSRRLDVGTEQLQDAAAQEQAVMNLGLEMQRSLDYYESQLRQVPPRQIHVIGHDRSFPLQGLLSGTLAAEIVPLPLGEKLELTDPDPRALYALGAARLVTEGAA